MLRDSEIRYRRLFEAAHDGVLLLDPVTRRITDANPFMTKLLGYPHRELVGKELFEIGLLRDEAASREMFRRLKRRHEIRYDNLPLETRAGRHQEVEVVANLYRENDRAVIQCNIRDITERKQAEVMLRRNEALFSALIAQAPFGVYVVDARLRLQKVNRAAEPVFRNVRPLIGRSFSEVIRLLWPRQVAARVMERFRRTLRTGRPYRSPKFVERRLDIGVKESYEWQIQRVTLPAGEMGVVCFFNDLTDRNNAEESRRRLGIMADTNRELHGEIMRRQAVEESLRKSEQSQKQLLEQSKHLNHQLLHAQEAERLRISRELHDEVAQTLVSINVGLAALKAEAGVQGRGFRRQLTRTQRLMERSVDIVHRFARDLRPTILDDLGLIPALHELVKGFSKQTGLHVQLTVFAGVDTLDMASRTVLYRVAQEALTNVRRHARASTVEVVLQKHDDNISMTIRDNGKCPRKTARQLANGGTRLGVIGMRERLEMVGGGFDIQCVEGKGTTVMARVPLGGRGVVRPTLGKKKPGTKGRRP